MYKSKSDSALVPALLCLVLGSSVQERAGATGKGPAEVTEIIWGLKHLSYEGRLQELDPFKPEEKRPRGDPINAYKYLKCRHQEGGARLFMVVPSDRMRSSDHKLKQRKFPHSMRKNFFMLRVAKPWDRLPKEVMESPSLEPFKTHLSMFLCHLL